MSGFGENPESINIRSGDPPRERNESSSIPLTLWFRRREVPRENFSFGFFDEPPSTQPTRNEPENATIPEEPKGPTIWYNGREVPLVENEKYETRKQNLLRRNVVVYEALVNNNDDDLEDNETNYDLIVRRKKTDQMAEKPEEVSEIEISLLKQAPTKVLAQWLKTYSIARLCMMYKKEQFSFNGMLASVIREKISSRHYSRQNFGEKHPFTEDGNIMVHLWANSYPGWKMFIHGAKKKNMLEMYFLSLVQEPSEVSDSSMDKDIKKKTGNTKEDIREFLEETKGKFRFFPVVKYLKFRKLWLRNNIIEETLEIVIANRESYFEIYRILRHLDNFDTLFFYEDEIFESKIQSRFDKGIKVLFVQKKWTSRQIKDFSKLILESEIVDAVLLDKVVTYIIQEFSSSKDLSFK